MILPDLSILLPRARVAHLHLELVREDIHQLGTVTILTTHNLLLGLVIVATGQKVAEDKLRHPDLVLRMLSNGDALAVILHTNHKTRILIFHRDSNCLDGICRGDAANASVTGIHHQLIKELIESWIELNLLVSHPGTVQDPSPLLVCLNGTDIGVWQLKDVLTVRKLLIVRTRCVHFCRDWVRGEAWQSIFKRARHA